MTKKGVGPGSFTSWDIGRAIVFMQPSTAVSSCGAKGESFQSYAKAVNLRRQVASLEAYKRAPALVLKMEATARD